MLETIRKAGPADAETLSAISRDTFTTAFAHLYEARDLAAFTEAKYSLDRAVAELSDPDIGVWLMEADGTTIGYALAGPCKLDNPGVTPECGEVHRLYLLPGHQGGGRGSRLLRTAMDWLTRRGPRAIWLGVFSGNAGAQRLYYRHGFAKVGEHTFSVGEQLDREFTLRRG